MLALKPVAFSGPLRLLFGILMLPTAPTPSLSLTRPRGWLVGLANGELIEYAATAVMVLSGVVVDRGRVLAD